MGVFLKCCGCAILFLSVFYIWGKALLKVLIVQDGLVDNILFGFVILLGLYQIPYVPAMLLRWGYRSITIPWIIIVGVATVGIVIWLIRNRSLKRIRYNMKEWAGIGIGIGIIIFLCCFISLHSPAYGYDTNAYISSMNDMYYNDRIWIKGGTLITHNGLNGLFGFMTIPSLLTNIRPYYMSLFTMRILLVVMTLLCSYRIGKIVFNETNSNFSFAALFTMLLTAILLVFWNSPYQAQFFIRRSNEAKSFCQFFLLPLALSVSFQMFSHDLDRKKTWILQLILGFSAVAVSMSSITSYLLLLFITMMALLVYDRFEKAKNTISWIVLCATPNLVCGIFYYFAGVKWAINL